MKRTLRWAFLLSPLLAFALVPFSGAQEEHAFIGAKKCKKCHLKQYRSWEATAMAQAFASLKPGVKAQEKTAAGLDPDKDYTGDAECVRCHVTGIGKPGGFVDVATTPDLVGVGCEMCHGPGGTYVQDSLMSLKNKEYKKSELVAAGLVDTVAVEQCQGCHNTDSPFVGDDYQFDFEANKTEGTHEKYPLKYSHD